MKKGRRGKYIVFEGGEGCGKSSQAKLLFEYLTSKGIDCVSTREPGGTIEAEEIRKLILSPANSLSEEARFFLFEAARAEVYKSLVIPSLKEGKVVITDRSAYSTLAYQGYGSKIDLNLIRRANDLATFGYRPDLLFVVDIPARLGLEKLAIGEFGKKDAMESKGLKFHQRVNSGFLKIAKENSDISVTVPYIEGGLEQMQDRIRGYVHERLGLP